MGKRLDETVLREDARGPARTWRSLLSLLREGQTRLLLMVALTAGEGTRMTPVQKRKAGVGRT